MHAKMWSQYNEMKYWIVKMGLGNFLVKSYEKKTVYIRRMMSEWSKVWDLREPSNWSAAIIFYERDKIYWYLYW